MGNTDHPNELLSANYVAGSAAYAPLTDAVGRVLTRQGASRVDVATAKVTRSTLTPQTVPTGLSTNEVVELSLLHFPTGKAGLGKYLLHAMPYPGSDQTKEYPSLWASNDAASWAIPSGVPYPIWPMNVQGDGQTSDGTLVEGPDGLIYLFWNQALNASPGGTGTGGNNWGVKVSSTADGITWTTPQTVLQSVITTFRPTCPAVLYDPSIGWVMYSFDIVPTACVPVRFTAPSPTGPWTRSADPVFPAWPHTNYSPYHANAVLWGDQHHLLINDTSNGAKGATGNLYLAVSDDGGATFQLSAPLLPTSAWYRCAMVPATTDRGPGYEVLLSGSVSGLWQVFKATLSFAAPPGGGVNGVLTADSLRILAAVRGVAGYTAGDSFNRTATAAALGTADFGGAWAVDSGTLGINAAGQAYAPGAGNNKSRLATTYADTVIECSAVWGTADQLSVYYRFQDASNFWRVNINNGVLIIQKIVAGSATTVYTALPLAVTSGRLKVVTVGSVHSAYVNDSLVAQVTDSAFATSTGAGIQLSTTGAFVDDFSVRPPINGI